MRPQEEGLSCISQECHNSLRLKSEQFRYRHPVLSKKEGDQACISCHLEENIFRKGLTARGTTKIHDSSLRNIHVVKLSSLTPSTKYQFKIQSTDAIGKKVVMESNDFVFTTEILNPPPSHFTRGGWKEEHQIQLPFKSERLLSRRSNGAP